MYRQEALVNGVWCKKTSPKGEWKPFTVEELSKKLDKALTENAMLKANLIATVDYKGEMVEVCKAPFEAVKDWINDDAIFYYFDDEDINLNEIIM